MGFYELNKADRDSLVKKMYHDLEAELHTDSDTYLMTCFADTDTYIRKAAYIAIGRIYKANKLLQGSIVLRLKKGMQEGNFYIRQTTVNAAGEIGMFDFSVAKPFMDEGLHDFHHSVRNAVIGSVKKMGQKNPEPVLAWAKQYLSHPDQEIRREICHGIELRGRTHPQDILPMLKTLEFDKTARVRNTLVHVLGQIAYKKGCLELVLNDLQEWENEALVKAALAEIVDVHKRYQNFAFYTQPQAIELVKAHFGEKAF